MSGPSKLTQWQHRIREHETLTPTERAVAFVLSTYMNKDTLKAWPSFETLAAGAGCSRDTVKRAVKVLEAEGLLWRKPGKYTGRASEYVGRWKEGGTQSKRGGHSEQKRGARVHPQHVETWENTPGASRSVGAPPLPALAPATCPVPGWERLSRTGVEQRAGQYEAHAAAQHEAADKSSGHDAAILRARGDSFAEQAAAARSWLAAFPDPHTREEVAA